MTLKNDKFEEKCLYRQDGIGKKHLATLEKVRVALDKLNEKMDVLIELQQANKKKDTIAS